MKIPFEKVVSTHADTVLRVCRAVLGAHDADDAWSESFLAALRAYPALDEDANVEAWLVTIAHRKALDVVRARVRFIEGEPPEHPAPERLLEHDDLYGALRALSARQREAVAYHYLAGLPYAEVAQVVGGTSDAARRAAADGIANLRNVYRNPLETGGLR